MSAQVDFISIIERLAREEVLNAEVRKDVANLQQEIRRGFERLDTRFAAIETRLVSTEDALKTAKLGWRLLVTIGGVGLALASSIGALLAKWLPVAGGLPK